MVSTGYNLTHLFKVCWKLFCTATFFVRNNLCSTNLPVHLFSTKRSSLRTPCRGPYFWLHAWWRKLKHRLIIGTSSAPCLWFRWLEGEKEARLRRIKRIGFDACPFTDGIRLNHSTSPRHVVYEAVFHIRSLFARFLQSPRALHQPTCTCTYDIHTYRA